MKVIIFLFTAVLVACVKEPETNQIAIVEGINLDESTDFYEFSYQCDAHGEILIAFHMDGMSLRYENERYVLSEIATDSGLSYKNDKIEFNADGQERNGLPIKSEIIFDGIKLQNCNVIVLG